MLQLVYTSKASSPVTADVVEALCKQARENNKDVEITGALAIKGDRFIQVLEGPKESVEDTFLRIMVDPRHHSVFLLSRSITTRRQFGDWEMAAYHDPQNEDDIIVRVAQITASATPDVQKAFADFMRSGS